MRINQLDGGIVYREDMPIDGNGIFGDLQRDVFGECLRHAVLCGPADEQQRILPLIRSIDLRILEVPWLTMVSLIPPGENALSGTIAQAAHERVRRNSADDYRKGGVVEIIRRAFQTGPFRESGQDIPFDAHCKRAIA